MNVGFIGLGNMGSGMARNLLRAGHSLTVYNRTRSRAESLAKDGARIAATPAEAARNAEAVITMLADDAALEEAVFGESKDAAREPAARQDAVQGGGASAPPNQASKKGALAPEAHGFLLDALSRGAVHISMSTISAALSRRLAQAHAARGQSYLAAPVLGRPEAAAAAKLLILAAGPEETVARCRPLLDALGQKTFFISADPPAANVVKLCSNFFLASVIESLGEAFALARKSGIASQKFLEVLTGTPMTAPLLQTYGSIIAEEKYSPPGFRLPLGLKDIRLVLAAGDAAGAPLPLASLLRDHFLTALARGYGELDWSAIAKLAADNAGLS